MSEYDGEVQLGVKLNPQDVQKSATKLAKSVESIFNANAGKEMNSSFKRVLATLDKNVSKGQELSKTLDELRDKKVPTKEFSTLVTESDKLSAQLKKVDASMEHMEKIGKTDTPRYRTLTKESERLGAELDKVNAKALDLKRAGLDMKIDPSVAPEISKVTQELNENNNAIRVNVSKFDEMAAKSGTVVSSMEAIGNSIQQLSPELAQLGDKIIETTQQMMSPSVSPDTSVFPNVKEEVQNMGTYAERASQQWSNSFDLIKQSIQDIPNLIKGIPAAVASGFEALKNRLSAGASSAADMKTSLEKVNSSVKKVSTSTASASKNVKTLGKSMNSTSSSAGKFDINLGKIFKKILMYGFGIRSVYMLVRKLRQAIADGLKSMAQMNNGANETNRAISQLSTSFYAFKNSIAAAVAPLVNLLAPALARIIDLLTSAMNAVASFIAALTGKSSFMKAVKVQQDFAGSLDKTAGSAKKAKKELQQLAGFDELNVLHKQEDESSGGGGGGGTAPAFEEVKVDPKILDMVNKLKEAWGKIKDYLNVLKDAFMSGFWEAMGDWQSKVDDIKKNLAIIGKDLKEIATDPAVLAAADNWAKSFAHMLGTTAGMFASIGLTLAQNLIGGFAKFLEEKKGEIKQWLIDMFDVKAALYNQISQFEVALARIFDVFGQEWGQKLTANILGIYWEVWSNLLLLGAKVGRDLVTLLTQPIIDNTEGFRSAFNGLLEIAAGAAETIKETLDSIFADVQTLYDEHIKPLFDSLTKAISWVVSLILSAWEQSIKPVLMDLQAKFKTMMEQHIAPAFTKISRLIGSLVDLIKTIFVPIIELLGARVRLMIGMIMPILQNAWTIVMERIGLIMDIIGDLADVIADMVDFVVAVLTGDWASAWESARAIVDDTVTLMTDLIKAKANMIISTVEGLINTVIGMINGLADGIVDVLGGLEFNIPDWVPVYGGKEFSIPAHVPHVPEVHFPRLAQGAVIPPNKEFMAVLGDQTSGTNIETPLDTMIEAFNAAKGDEEALLREQNDILRQLLYKEWRLDPKDVFNATRAQNQDFIRRTGKSAFAY